MGDCNGVIGWDTNATPVMLPCPIFFTCCSFFLVAIHDFLMIFFRTWCPYLEYAWCVLGPKFYMTQWRNIFSHLNKFFLLKNNISCGYTSFPLSYWLSARHLIFLFAAKIIGLIIVISAYYKILCCTGTVQQRSVI